MNGRISGAEFGHLVRARRIALGLDLDAVAQAIGGTPGPGFLGRLEDGSIGPSSSLVLKLAVVLDLPADQMLNASGFATENQRAAALDRLAAAPPRGAIN